MMIPMRFGWSRSIPNLSTSALVLAGMVTATVPGCNTSGNASAIVVMQLPGGEVRVEVNIEWGAPQTTLPDGSVYIGTADVNGRKVEVHRDPEGNFWIRTKGSEKYNKVTKGLEDIQERLTPPPPPPGGGGRPGLVPQDGVPVLPEDGPLVNPTEEVRPLNPEDQALVGALRGVLAMLPPRIRSC